MLSPTRSALCATVLLVVPSLRAQNPTQEVRHLVQVRIHQPRELDRLLALDLDLASCQALEPPVRVVEVIAYDRDLATLRASGLDHDIAIRDLAAWYERELARHGGATMATLTPPVGQGGMGGHYTLAEMEAILDSFANDHPGRCAPKVSIGQSIQGRDIWMVKISDNVATPETEPRAYFDAVHHAREPVSLTTTLAYMDWLLSNYGTDPTATFIVDERELFFVPCVNPDGYEYNRSTNPGGGGMWRKNRRANAGGSYGVDLNRNYTTGWTAPNGGNSTSPSSDVYRGTAPFSEPETQAVETFMTGMGFVVTCSLHTYTDVLLHPWAWQSGGPSSGADYAALGPYFTDDNRVNFGPVSTLLYIAAGGAVDHHHAVHGSNAWTPELGRASEGGFWPVSANQVAIVDRHWTMLRDMSLAAGAALAIDAIVVTEEPGGNGNGTVEPGEVGEVTVTVGNAGLAALTGSAQVGVQSLSPGVTVLTGAASIASLPRLGSGTTSPSTLRIDIDSNYLGVTAQLRVTVIGGGQTVTTDLEFPTRIRRLLLADDMERDRGFTRAPNGTATTGRWERAAPQQTTSGGFVIQPGTQTTPAGSLCQVTDGRAGASAGTYDVDGGYTDLLTPVMDLAHVTAAEISFDYWFMDSANDDAVDVDLSSDGGSNWQNIWSSRSAGETWNRLALPLPEPLTDRMVVRFRAQDLFASLVEVCVDGFEVRGVAPVGAVTILSSGAIGTDAHIGFVGEGNAAVVPLVSLLRAGPLTIPGIGGVLHLEPLLLVAYPALSLDAAGSAAIDIAIPNDPALRGGDLHWQGLHVAAGQFALGNVTTLRVR